MARRNRMSMTFDSRSENVGIARVAAAAFSAQIEFTLPEIEEIKVAISEAVSNAVIHGYSDQEGQIELAMELYETHLEYTVIDWGKGIADVEQARQPAWSTEPERMGLGFVFMESFMDEIEVTSALGKGTTVRMVKKFDAVPIH
ncbi:anti-sigma F factor [Anaerosporomusa subterranea]|uniref:Anti-sigma F factor n=1 Tax=Anaerosporomusa subterranea TaxID=1794912 RepID=A0A154BUE8_ANASB|nr:anti-sigma F factor [Anaerosporomusa subterranea]KYZ77495.1 anti-sigma F factor [Anaerosporomusa subterranea]